MKRRKLLGVSIAASCVVALFGVASAGAAAKAAKVSLSREQRALVVAETTGSIVNYASAIPGTNAYIGLATRGAFVEGYICDGDKIAVWFKGTLKNGNITASNVIGNVVLKGKATSSGFVGEVNLGGKEIGLTTPKVTYPNGLWRAVNSADSKIVKAGWVLLADGTQRGAKVTAGLVGSVDALVPGTQGVDTGSTGIADPVAFKKTVAKKDKPPLSTCAALEAEYNRLREIADSVDGTWSDANKTTAGQSATNVYKQGMSHSCGWSPSPSGPGSAS